MADEPYTYENEEWRDIPGWEGYQVSDLGRVRSLPRVHRQPHPRNTAYSFDVPYPGKIRSQNICPQTGYCKVGLYIRSEDKRRTLAVHVLVCSAFHGPRPDGCCVAHNNGVRSDNRAFNLRWATQRENMADCKIHGTVNRGERNGQAKLTDVQFVEMARLRKRGATTKELSEQFNLCPSQVLFRLSGKRRKPKRGKNQEQSVE